MGRWVSAWSVPQVVGSGKRGGARSSDGRVGGWERGGANSSGGTTRGVGPGSPSLTHRAQLAARARVGHLHVERLGQLAARVTHESDDALVLVSGRQWRCDRQCHEEK